MGLFTLFYGSLQWECRKIRFIIMSSKQIEIFFTIWAVAVHYGMLWFGDGIQWGSAVFINILLEPHYVFNLTHFTCCYRFYWLGVSFEYLTFNP